MRGLLVHSPLARSSRRRNGALSANVRETVARTKFSVEGEQAKAAREFIIESSPHSPALPDGSDVQSQEAVFHRRVQEEGPAGGRRLHGARSGRLTTSARGAVLVASGGVARSA